MTTKDQDIVEANQRFFRMIEESYRLTTDHPASSYGIPVLVDLDGHAFGPRDRFQDSPDAAEAWRGTAERIFGPDDLWCVPSPTTPYDIACGILDRAERGGDEETARMGRAFLGLPEPIPSDARTYTSEDDAQDAASIREWLAAHRRYHEERQR